MKTLKNTAAAARSAGVRLGLSVLGLAMLAMPATAQETAQEAETPGLPEVMEEISANAEKLESWRADFSQEVNMAGLQMTSTGEMQAKGQMSRGHINMDMMGQAVTMKTVTDKDNVAWIEMDMMGQPMIMRMDMSDPQAQEMAGMTMPGGMSGGVGGMSNDPQAMLEMLQEMGEVSYEGKQELDGQSMHVLESKLNQEFMQEMDAGGELSQMGVELDKMRLWVDPEYGFTRKLAFLDPQGNTAMSVMFTNFEPNVELDESLFSYTPPEGVPVMDMNLMMQAGPPMGGQPEPGGQPAPSGPQIETEGGTDPEEGTM